MKTYDSNEIIVILGTHIVDAGRDNGDFLTFATDADEYTKTVGADGEVVLNRSNDRSINATLTLLKTSLSNDYLSALVSADRLKPGGNTYAFAVRQTGGTTLITAQAKITVTPRSNAAWGPEVGTYQWGFVLANVVEFYGGLQLDIPV